MGATEIPTNPNGQVIPLTPDRVTLARTVSATISSSTQITFNASTKFLRVYAIDKDVYLKWGTTACSSSNFDEVIPANQVVDLIVPKDLSLTTPALFTAATVIERAATATIIVIEK